MECLKIECFRAEAHWQQRVLDLKDDALNYSWMNRTAIVKPPNYTMKKIYNETVIGFVFN
jgi:hypothetical protein